MAGTTALVGWAGDWTGAAPLGPETGRLLVAGIAIALLGLAADLLPVPPVVCGAGVAVAAALTVPYDELGMPAGCWRWPGSSSSRRASVRWTTPTG